MDTQVKQQFAFKEAIFGSIALPKEPFADLQALAAREQEVNSNQIAVIVYVRDLDKHNDEVSGYIDFHKR